MDRLPDDLIAALERAHPEHCETHISRVFLGPSEVYKLKKPVRFPFLDFSSLALRKAACEAEVRLNRRLSPDVYLGVLPLTEGVDGTPRFGGEGPALDYVVHMRRLSDDLRADVMLARSALSVEHLEALATVLAEFHARAEIDRDPSGPGARATLEAHVSENLEALAACFGRALTKEAEAELCDAQLGGVSRLLPVIEARLRAGHVRDGHGDLRLDHVYFLPDGSIRVLDCVEFDRAFRVADVCADVAFMAMNLCEAGRFDLAERFVAHYARESADHGLYALLDFFMTYWALVRAKVCEARAAQGGGEAEASRAHAERLVRLGHRLSCGTRAPAVLLAVGGVIGSGKSRLGQRLAHELSAPVLQSDRLRKQLQGVAPAQRLDAQRGYSADATEALYAELFARASTILSSGRSVIVDASFRSRAHRRALYELAAALSVPCLFLECTAPREVLEQRLRAREHKASVSDARIELLDSFLAHYEPLTEDELSHRAMRVDTTGTREATYGQVAPRLGSMTGVADAGSVARAQGSMAQSG